MITVNDSGSVVLIGRAGENDYVEVSIDASCWTKKYPGCEITGVFRRPDGAIYSIPLQQKSGIMVWRPAEADTYPGCGALELHMHHENTLGKSAMIRTICGHAIQTPDNHVPPVNPPSGAQEGDVLTWSSSGAVWKATECISDSEFDDLKAALL